MTGTSSGTINTVASGTGTLMIPGGATFTNILQVKALQNVNVSLMFGFITATVVSTNYSYYHSTQKAPLLEVSYTDIQGSFSSNTATIKLNSSVVTGINDINFDATFNIFPNPAKEYVKVKLNNLNNDVCKVEIINSIGQLAKTIDLGMDSEISRNITISDLNSGVYLVRTTLGDKVSTRKLIVE